MVLFKCRLDLDKWINDPPSDSSEEDIPGPSFFTTQKPDEFRSYNNDTKAPVYEPTEEELEQVEFSSVTIINYILYYIVENMSKLHDLGLV